MKKKQLHAVPLKNISINDGYWNKYIDLVPSHIIPYQWKVLNDKVQDAAPSYCIQNFKIAAGEASGERQGAVFQDSDVGKWLEAVSYSLATAPNKELEALADSVIALIGRAQCDDGYINTYFTLKENGRRWKNLTMGHELYTAGHLIEAAVAYYDATDKNTFLNIMCHFADLICKEFGPGENQRHGYPGHEEIELALIKLYHTTGNQEYLDTAKYFVETRGKKPNYFLNEINQPDFHPVFDERHFFFPAYSQSDVPPRKQEHAEGHAVRAVYLYCAMADLAEEYQDEQLLERCRILWNDMVNRQMYITGSIGSCANYEGFTTDYDLPNDINYSETCASIGLALFGLRMSRATKDAQYIDIVEKALYNTVRAGISLEGDRYFYVNPLEVWPESCLPHSAKEHVKPVRQKWFDVACCPTNIARTLTSLGQYIYSIDDSNLFLNLFISNETTVNFSDKPVAVKVKTNFPADGDVSIHVQAETDTAFALNLRIPEYAEDYTIFINDQAQSFDVRNHYAVLRRTWNHDTVKITFKMRAKLICANPRVRADIGKAAIVRGPEVFCLEETDNGANLASIFIAHNTPLTVLYDKQLFGGTNVISLPAKKLGTESWDTNTLYREAAPSYSEVNLRAVPYAYWGNRTPGEMTVWIHTLG